MKKYIVCNTQAFMDIGEQIVGLIDRKKSYNEASEIFTKSAFYMLKSTDASYNGMEDN